MTKRFQSIRWSLQWWYGLLLAATIATLAVSFYFYERNLRLARADTALTATVDYLIPRLIPPGGRHRPFPMEPADARGPRDGRGPAGASGPPEVAASHVDPLHYWIAWRATGEVLRHSPNLPENVEPPGDTQTRTILRSRGDLREAFHKTPHGSAVLAGVSREALLAGMRPLKLTLAAGGSLLFLGIMIPAWWLTGRSLRPIDTISKTAGRIVHGDYAGRIDAGHVRNELGQLAAVLNESFARLDEARKEQLRFTADASHELRTPLSVIIADGELALRRERAPEHYQKTIRICVSSALHMRDVIESLMEISRLDTQGVHLETEPADLAALATECIALLEPLARSSRIEFRAKLTKAPCIGHPQKLRQVIINLIGNAIHHNTAPGWVAVETGTEPEEGRAFLRVTDSGPGIAPEDLPHVFNRFYRGDASRSDSSHSGLGLAITRAIVEAHGGRIAAASPPDSGAVFTITLPLA